MMDYRLLMLLLTRSFFTNVAVGLRLSGLEGYNYEWNRPTFNERLECPSCSYVNDSHYLNLNLWKTDKCTRPIYEDTSRILKKPCEPREGWIARCSFHKGSIDLEDYSNTYSNQRVSLQRDTVNSIQIYIHGCYYSPPANIPSNGCHNRINISEDTSILQEVMTGYSSTKKVVAFKGEVCFCSDTYCQTVDQTTAKTTGQTSSQTSGSSSEFGAVCLVLSVPPVLFVLLKY